MELSYLPTLPHVPSCPLRKPKTSGSPWGCMSPHIHGLHYGDTSSHVEIPVRLSNWLISMPAMYSDSMDRTRPLSLTEVHNLLWSSGDSYPKSCRLRPSNQPHSTLRRIARQRELMPRWSSTQGAISATYRMGRKPGCIWPNSSSTTMHQRVRAYHPFLLTIARIPYGHLI